MTWVVSVLYQDDDNHNDDSIRAATKYTAAIAIPSESFAQLCSNFGKTSRMMQMCSNPHVAFLTHSSSIPYICDGPWAAMTGFDFSLYEV